MLAQLFFLLLALWQAELLPSCGLPRWRRRTAVRRIWRWFVMLRREYGEDWRVLLAARLGAAILAGIGLWAWWWSVFAYVFKSNLHP